MPEPGLSRCFIGIDYAETRYFSTAIDSKNSHGDTKFTAQGTLLIT
jgi:hypothetical protein